MPRSKIKMSAEKGLKFLKKFSLLVKVNILS